jgi:NAD(P)-dependent dehydrogenase (short-subunit alcohol dehydrogenase family)
MAAMILSSPPQFGQCSMSISNTRLSSLAQLSRTGRWCSQFGVDDEGTVVVWVVHLVQPWRAVVGTANFVFNNAGVGAAGLIWEHTQKDWEWVVGVNLMGVAHGVRVFTPLMLAAAKADPAFSGHIVNTASMAGLLNAPNMGVYNVTKHAVVSLSETLYQDLALVTEQVHAHVLCPFSVPTGIDKSHRNRPAEVKDGAKPTKSQLIAQAMSEQAVSRGKISAAEVAQFIFDAMAGNRFYAYSHPKSLASVTVRLEDVMTPRNPTAPFEARPDIGQQLRQALREGS